ncbi:glycoside hydrolase family 48 protein [Aquimarina sp. 2201CG14-23]|uniref:glycoside hydrolase family 48 protein n=1 Tax=Aquimarina mycalae TaxID=3040073 RepID=UPI00247813B7|nr:glycoside hydrolase family 48 protein [Aquimarina sp. 2201CG14-23]MDH7444459.1 glycoside hydrolase family 48 protein [Aquimarina sp. 2201CG14-23]
MRNFIKISMMLMLYLFCVKSTAQFNYGEALQKSLLFYETQQSGKLPDWNRISWRSDSGVNDGADVGLDLTGGWNDAGDHVKFGFPMAFSVTALNWGFLEYKEGYDTANQTEHFKRNIKWVTDYFIKCHPSPNVFYAQVADSKSQDHNFWMPAEMVDVHPMYGQRKSYALTTSNPGTDVACETAAALASASIIFKDSDPTYSATLLSHAIELYEFGDNHRGLYTSEGNIPAVGTYTSGNYQDELTWGALWLYKATGDQKYLDKAEAEYAQPDFLWSLVWEDKSYGNMVLLSIITGKETYKADAERHLDWWQQGNGGVNYSPGGQAHLTQWGSLRHAMNASLTALIYSDNVNTPKSNQYRNFAINQVNYALGDNPNNRSLVTGFGVNPPTKPHHRGQHSSWSRSSANPVESRHTMWGALMGGPAKPDDFFEEDRDDFQANEVATDYNACYQGVLARMVMEFGGSSLPNFPQPETPGLEFANEVKLNNDQSRFTEVAIWLNNRSGWPARVPNTLKARYFIDISEGIAAGFNAGDYELTARGAGNTTTTGLQEWDAGSNIFYAEIEVDQDKMPFPGGQGEYRSEIQLRISLPTTAPETAWDASNDFSYQGLTSGLQISDNVPIYADGILVGGKEPNGGEVPTASFTATPESGTAPLEVSFDASGSSDPNGDTITYSWDFGNGQTSSVVDPLITYTSIGSYLVTLTVSDGANTSSEFTRTITVLDGNIAPIAEFSANPTTGVAPVTVSFDASGSSDENGDSLTYIWDFGDGETGSGISVNHEYTTIGEFEAKLTVSDGSKEDSKTTSIIVTDGSPVASFTMSADSGIIPLDVVFDASGSSDPAGGNLTYSWDLGNGDTASTVTTSTTYTEVGQVTVRLTVTNAAGDTDSETKTISLTDGSVSCTFNTPISNPLPTINSEFQNIFVLGDGGPNFDNVTKFNINWDLANNGLYQFSMNTNNGTPNWWNDFLPKVTQNFNASQPEITITDSGFAGFDGTYYATIDEGNFVLVSKVGGFTIYFSTTATAPDCDSTTNPTAPDGGTIVGGPFIFTVGDGIADNVSGITLSGNEGTNFQWVVTDDQNNILGLPANIEAVDFDGAGEGTCLIWHLSYEDGLQGLVTNNNVSDLIGDFDFSNSISVIRNVVNPVGPDGGTIVGGPFTFTVGDGIADNVSGITLSGNEGANFQWVVTDDQNNILGLPANIEAVDFDGAGEGTCLIWHLSYEDGLQGLIANNNVSDLIGDFDFSNSISVVRNPVTDGNDCSFDTPISSALPSINNRYENIYVLGSGGPDPSNIREFSINWDLANNGLYQFAINTNNGTPDWYIDLRGNLTHNFNTSQPEAVLSGTQVSGLDGAYWVNVDGDNFVMVSKNGGYTLYFSTTSTQPNCDNTGGGNTNPVADISATPISGEAPLLVTFDASASTDEDGDALSYSWDFGDGNTGDGVTTENTFVSKGTYSATLTVTDGNNGIDQAVVTITVTDGDIIINPPTGDNAYIDRFIEMRNEFYDPANGYFSADGSPHHSIETLIVEAPDHGHESTSELYSYWLWLEVMNGRITKDWAPLNNVWNKIEEFIIPTTADQPTNAAYNASSPAAYASEFPLPSDYPAPLSFSAPVGSDPVSPDLTATYGADIYQMHWLLDNDNFYGYGNRGDGVSTPSYINTFQRGEQESVYETVPHPSWESFEWGGSDGYLPLFIEDQNYAKQWRYTSAPDADARAVQAMYWAQVYAKEQGASLGNLDLDKASKMGDFLRLSMFDKYFKPMGVQSATSGAGSGYDSAHYLMSWYMSWGGSADPASQWAFRISSSHCHFGYQNPVAAYALTQVDELKPQSQNGERDWNESLKRQMEFYTWLQSKEGAIAGGATNSWNGDYSSYPAGKSTFYDMAFDTNPVYHDPGSGTWFGWQAWSMERVAEYYYITNDPMAKSLMDKWVTWVKSEVKLIGDDDFEIPATLEWTGEPDTWDSNNPGNNTNLSVVVTDYGKDLGVAASMAKALIYYAAATQKHAVFDTDSRDLAKEVLDRMWNKYRDDKGVSSPEDRGDFKRIFEEEVYIPNGFIGTMPNGDEIKPGVTFLDIRSGYKNDPEFERLETAYNAGQDFTQRYHRSWAQIEVALANAEYGFFFGDEEPSNKVPVNQFKVSTTPNPATDYINISTNFEMKNTRIRIIDIAGNVIRKEPMLNKQKSTRLSVEELPSGLYILEIFDITTGEKFRNKIIKN